MPMRPTPTPLAALGLAMPSRALALAGKARLRLRDHASPLGGVTRLSEVQAGAERHGVLRAALIFSAVCASVSA